MRKVKTSKIERFMIGLMLGFLISLAISILAIGITLYCSGVVSYEDIRVMYDLAIYSSVASAIALGLYFIYDEVTFSRLFG